MDNYYREILFEQNIKYDGLSKEEGDYCLAILLNSTEIESCDLLGMYLKKEGDDVSFSGESIIDNIVTTFTGQINKKSKKIYVLNSVEKISEKLSDKQRKYEIYECFEFKKNKIVRITMKQYDTETKIAEMPLLDTSKVEKLRESFEKQL